jgi:glycine C-acetyltransferase
MSDTRMREHLRGQLEQLKKTGLYKRERLIESPQGPVIRVGGREVINFCANNYLGLANHPEVVEAAHEGLRRWGFGLSSVRFICGTQNLHKELEGTISRFFGKEDAILYTSCFDANGGLFETLLGEEDAVLSDELNHASIIDGIRLCKAQRFRYRHSDMEDLRRNLDAAQNARFRLIVTDSVFSMDGDLAKLADICDLADQYSALAVIDDSHGTGHLGKSGRGAAEELGVLNRIDIITSTLGKTLGGGSGGFTVGGAEIVDWLRNRSRPYLFSNSLTASLVSAAHKAFELIDRGSELRDRLASNTKQMRSGLEGAGFTLRPGPTPILPVMLGDAALATQMAERLLGHEIYVIGFSYPVVPQGQARIRLQVSAAHTSEQIDRAIRAFCTVGKELRIIR